MAKFINSYKTTSYKNCSQCCIDDMLAEMVKAIVDEVDPVQIILFGSQAKGNAKPDSDVDLLVVEEQPFGPQRSRYKEIKRIRRSLSSYRVPKDILVYSQSEVDTWRNSINHIIARSLREGRVIYERY